MTEEFVCDLCGRCCMGLGRYVKVKAVMPGNKVAVVHEMGKETCFATIEKPFRDIFDEDGHPPPHENWCPFLCEIKEGEEYRCMIYETRPEFCRNFQCNKEARDEMVNLE